MLVFLPVGATGNQIRNPSQQVNQLRRPLKKQICNRQRKNHRQPTKYLQYRQTGKPFGFKDGPYLSPAIGLVMQMPVYGGLEKATSTWEDQPSVFIAEVSR